MKAILAIVGVAACVLSSPACADPTPPAKAKAGNAVKDPNEVVCRREAEAGSLIASKQKCMTRAEWAAMEREHQHAARDFLSSSTPTGGN